MYTIKVTFYYYAGTYAPEDGYLTDREGYRLEFETFEEAFEYLIAYYGLMKLVKGKTTFVSASDFYLLDYGEYSKPEYTIRKMRGGKA